MIYNRETEIKQRKTALKCKNTAGQFAKMNCHDVAIFWPLILTL